jgi:hypothetical protein
LYKRAIACIEHYKFVLTSDIPLEKITERQTLNPYCIPTVGRIQGNPITLHTQENDHIDLRGKTKPTPSALDSLMKIGEATATDKAVSFFIILIPNLLDGSACSKDVDNVLV